MRILQNVSFSGFLPDFIKYFTKCVVSRFLPDSEGNLTKCVDHLSFSRFLPDSRENFTKCGAPCQSKYGTEQNWDFIVQNWSCNKITFSFLSYFEWVEWCLHFMALQYWWSLRRQKVSLSLSSQRISVDLFLHGNEFLEKSNFSQNVYFPEVLSRDLVSNQRGMWREL